MGRFGQFGSKLANHGPFWSVRVQIGQSRAVLVSWGPNWPITGRFGQLGSKMANHGPFWPSRVPIGQSRAVLVISGPNWPNTARFSGLFFLSNPRSIHQNVPCSDFKVSLKSTFFFISLLLFVIISIFQPKITIGLIYNEKFTFHYLSRTF